MNIEKMDLALQNLLIEKYRQLYLIRQVELSIGEYSRKGVFRTPVHLAIGQEAIAVGVSTFLRNTDYVFGNHRSHAHYLALGGSTLELIAEILGKKAGCSGGKGGSMHIKSPQNGFMGSMPIVAGTISLAVGAALQIPTDSDQIAVSYFGDGATEEGVFHESLNFASNFNAPTLFVCENNLFSSHMHIHERQTSSEMSRFAESFGIKTFQVDGNSLIEVLEIAQDAIEYVRENRKPAFIEAHTYRIYSHVGFEEDLDIGNFRLSDLGIWKERDPLRLLESHLDKNFGNVDLLAVIKESIDSEIRGYWEYATKLEYPQQSDLLTSVYADFK
jgi:TPP-dependent pyruvate/acetoin dehydrogenase alpha subunit